jgi:nitrogen fixation/metabolism regulation signal transduction histidine kinase
VNLRRKFILYLIVLHLIFAVFAFYALRGHRLWILAVEGILVVSFILAQKLHRGLFRPLDLIATGAEFIKDSDFTSGFRKMGQPEMDQLIDVYNQMVDHLRNERTRLQEQYYLMDKILGASPSGIVTFDYDGRIDIVNPAAEKILQASAEELRSKTLAQISTPFADALHSVAVDGSEVIPLQGRRRLKCRRSQFLDRGFPRNFVLMEELTEELRRSEKAAYEKLIRVMSHEVNNSIGAANSLLHSCLNYRNYLLDTRLDKDLQNG